MPGPAEGRMAFPRSGDGLFVGWLRFDSSTRIPLSKTEFVLLWIRFLRMILVAPPGLEPGLSALKGPRVNQLHHGAKHTQLRLHYFNYMPSAS
jgi:hypothetical protein